MDLSRLRSVMDVARLERSKVALVGTGGSSGLAGNLVRCGVGALCAVDFDRVSIENIARQRHQHDHLGLTKVEALARQLKTINPAVNVAPLTADFTTLSEGSIDDHFADCDLLIFATDRFAAQARGNEVALRLQKPALWLGLYPRGRGGEVIFWHPQINACYRCLVSARYEAQKEAREEGKSLDPSSDGTTIFDIEFLDSIAGQVAIGLLTRGAKNRFGQLIDELGDRNFIQVKIAPSESAAGRDVVREKLGVPMSNDAFFAWNSVVLRDPTAHVDACPDCARFRGDETRGPRNQRKVGDGTERLWPVMQNAPERVGKNGRGRH